MKPVQHALTILLTLMIIMTTMRLFVAHAAATDADRAMSRFARVHELVAETKSLIAQSPGWTQRTQPALGKGGLTTAVNDSLASAGIPASSLVSLSPAAETPVSRGAGESAGGVGLSAFRRRAVLTLAPLTLPQVGKLLAAWRDAHPDWTISAIDLNPEHTGRREAAALAPGSDLPLRAVIAIEALYVNAAANPTGPQTGASR